MAREPATRGLRDEASVGPDPRRARELRRLSELNYRVADGEPNIVGWPVFASTGREVVRVADLLVDAEAHEVVMLDLDLRRGDQHTLAPIRAAWIDQGARRVVLDARELEQSQGDELLPGLPRSGALSDDDVRRFNDGYVRAYGDRGVERDARWRLARGDEELHFGVEPRADLAPTHVRQDDVRPGAGHGIARAGGVGAAGASAAPPPVFDESRRIDRIMDEANALPPSAGGSASSGGERRVARVDDARALDDAQSISPRELDARVRIDEGGSVDERAPVGGVRYEGTDPVRHDYGRPDERYGAEYGTGRIGFDRVVSRHRREPDVAPHDAATHGTSGPSRIERDAADVARRLGDAADRPTDRGGDPLTGAQDTVRYRRYDDAR